MRQEQRWEEEEREEEKEDDRERTERVGETGRESECARR
jgi:hypothetical protein